VLTSRLVAVGLVLAVAACGGEEAPAPGTPSDDAPPPPPAAPQAQDDLVQNPTQLVREEFSYRGGSRDPFVSLVRPGGEDRPRVNDIKVSTIIYDAVYPIRSVAVVRDTVEQVRYELRIDDELGRFRVADIRPRELVVAIDEFGTERLVVLSLRSLQEDAQ
jgi:hypothetical protein